MKKLFVLLLLVQMSGFAVAREKKQSELTVKDLVLSNCIFDNYHRLGIPLEQFNDISSLNVDYYGPEDWDKILAFTNKHTSEYYKNSVMVHLEESGDKMMNTIFSDCMKFYYSKELKNFLKKNKY